MCEYCLMRQERRRWSRFRRAWLAWYPNRHRGGCALIRWGTVTVLLCVTGCSATYNGTVVRYNKLGEIHGNGFLHEELPYQVASRSGTQELMGSDWLLDNFYKKKGQWLPKKNDEYLDRLQFDIDGDGRYEEARMFYNYDLRFLHRKRSSVIWLSTFPLSDEHAETDFKVLAERYVEAIAGGTGQATIQLGRRVRTADRRYSTRMLGMRDVSVSGQPALEFTFEVANVDQLELARDSRVRHVRIVMLRPGYHVPIGKARYRALMVLGCSAMPGDFNAALPDFVDLVGRLELYPDGVLDVASDDALACLGAVNRDSLEVALRVDGAGRITDVSVEPEAQIGEYAPVSTSGGAGVFDQALQHNEALRDQLRDINACLEKRLVGHIQLASTGKARGLSWTYERGLPSRQPRPHAAYASAPLSAEQPSKGAPTSPAAMKAPAPATAAVDEAALRERIDSRRADVLACTGTERLALELAYAADKVEVALRGELHGSAEEGCVRQVLGAMAAPRGEGRMVHLVH